MYIKGSSINRSLCRIKDKGILFCLQRAILFSSRKSEVGSRKLKYGSGVGTVVDKNVGIADRSKAFAIRIIKACSFLDEKPGICRTLSKQLLRSGTSVGANIRESRSAQSDKDFLHKMEIALKEARETEYWLEILIESEVVEKSKFYSLLQEADEIVKILVASTRKIKERLNGNKLRSSKIVVARDKHSELTTTVNSKAIPPS